MTNRKVKRIEVKPGQVWRDCDKRSGDRKVEITAVDGDFAYYEKPKRGRIRLKRMYPHGTGYELVSEAPAQQTEQQTH